MDTAPVGAHASPGRCGRQGKPTYLELDIKQEGASFMGSKPPLAEIYKKPGGSIFLTVV